MIGPDENLITGSQAAEAVLFGKDQAKSGASSFPAHDLGCEYAVVFQYSGHGLHIGFSYVLPSFFLGFTLTSAPIALVHGDNL